MDNEMTTEVGMAIGATLVERSYTRVVEIPDGPLPDIDGQPADNWFQHCNFTNEKKFEIISHMPTYDCCICRKTCRGYGNNAQPVREGQCCGRCNQIVIRARILEMRR
jgi:hypothetical protein